MANNYIYIQDLREHARVPQNGILSQTLQDGAGTKIVLFGFAPGQELSAHTAPYPATIMILEGEASLKIGPDEQQGVEGTLVYMAPYLEHGIKAKTEVVMLLTMIKSQG